MLNTKKLVIFLVAICLGLTLLTPIPAKADVDVFFPITVPLYAAGAIISLPFDILGSLFYTPGYYYPDAGYYYYPPAYYGGYYGPYYGHYGGYYRPRYGYYGGYHGGYHGGYYGGYHGGYHTFGHYGDGHRR